MPKCERISCYQKSQGVQGSKNICGVGSGNGE